MYPFILCFCGRSLGELYDLFVELKRAKLEVIYADYEGLDPEIIPVDPDSELTVGDILDDLGLHLACCRMHIMCQVPFKDYY